jgi:hypothetical protein
MAGVTDSPDYDPIRRSRQEADRFNVAWMKNGEKLSWVQRIGFAVISFVFFSAGLLFGTLAVNDIRNGEFLGAIGWSVPTLIFLVLGFSDSEMFCGSD